MRLIWLVLLVIGPVAIYAVVAGEGDYVPAIGFWFWALGVILVAIAPWCVSAWSGRERMPG